MDETVLRELEIIKESVLAIIPDTEAIYLFGSYANGTPHKDSDLDIYIVVPDTIEQPQAKTVDIRMRMADSSRLPLDMIANNVSTFKRRSSGLTFESVVARKGRVIYRAA
ncbi:MAG: nucleotidyltransferase domain-containing protein [Oscillospiraceae bacterium]|nr:nucleotidyltransferase domain-containing protein [Oscillospiraceae bacterium]